MCCKVMYTKERLMALFSGQSVCLAPYWGCPRTVQQHFLVLRCCLVSRCYASWCVTCAAWCFLIQPGIQYKAPSSLAGSLSRARLAKWGLGSQPEWCGRPHGITYTRLHKNCMPLCCVYTFVAFIGTCIMYNVQTYLSVACVKTYTCMTDLPSNSGLCSIACTYSVGRWTLYIICIGSTCPLYVYCEILQHLLVWQPFIRTACI